MEPVDLVIRNASWLYTVDGQNTVLAGAYLSIDAGRISEVAPEPFRGAAEREIDASGCIVMPGFINTHHHFFQTLTRAVPCALRTDSLEWLEALYPLWAYLDTDDLAVASAGAAAELLLTGATTSVDFSYLLPEQGMVAAEIAAVSEAGLRFHLVRGSLPLMEGQIAERLRRVLGSQLTRIIDDPDVLLERCHEELDRYHDPSPHSMVQVALGPTGITYDNPRLMGQFAELAERFGSGLHTHYHPRPGETQRAQEAGYPNGLALLEDQGWLDGRTWLAHGTELDEPSVEKLASTQTGLAHCPRCILRLGYEVAPVVPLRRSGGLVGIGVDGSASNDGSAMLDELRLALLLHRVAGRSGSMPPVEWPTPTDVLRMATSEGAELLGRDDLGRLEVGCAADVIGFKMDGRIDFAGAMQDPLAGLLMTGTSSRTAFTVVNGQILVRDGELVRTDETELAHQVQAASDRLIRGATEATGIDFLKGAS